MILSEHYLDKMLSNKFSSEIVEGLSKHNLDFLSVKLSSKKGSEPVFGLYYTTKYSKELYKKKHYKNNLIKYLFSKEMVETFNICMSHKDDVPVFHLGLTKRTPKNTEGLLSYLSKEYSFYSKYKTEFDKFAKYYMPEQENNLIFQSCIKYISTYEYNSENKDLKLSTLETTDIPFFKSLDENFDSIYEIFKDKIDKCGGFFSSLEKSYYVEKKSHINLYNQTDLSFSPYKFYHEFSEMFVYMPLIQEWHNLHKEFDIQFWSFGNDSESEDNYTLEIYFKLRDY